MKRGRASRTESAEPWPGQTSSSRHPRRQERVLVTWIRVFLAELSVVFIVLRRRLHQVGTSVRAFWSGETACLQVCARRSARLSTSILDFSGGAVTHQFSLGRPIPAYQPTCIQEWRATASQTRRAALLSAPPRTPCCCHLRDLWMIRVAGVTRRITAAWLRSSVAACACCFCLHASVMAAAPSHFRPLESHTVLTSLYGDGSGLQVSGFPKGH